MQLVGIQEWIDEGVSMSILSMDPGTEKLIIPINTQFHPTWTRGAEQWHLLIFDIKNNKWEHYNSDQNGQVGERCVKDSKTMATYCKQPLNTWLANQQRRAEVDCTFIDVKGVAQPRTFYEECCPDSLLYMCNWIKLNCQANPGRGCLAGGLTLKKKRRVDMAYKLLNASHPEYSWGRFSNFEFLNNLAGGFTREDLP